MKWIVVLAIVVVICALGFAASQTELTIHLVVATTLDVFFSVVLGLGLVALAFFSAKASPDDVAADATKPKDDKKP